MSVGVVGFIVFMERAQRRILVQYPKRQVGNKMFGGDASHLPLKINTSGVIPPIFASSLLLLPATIANFQTKQPELGWLGDITAYLAHGRPLYMALYVALIVFFASSIQRSYSTRPRRPTICANMAGSSPASGPAKTPPTISTMS